MSSKKKKGGDKELEMLTVMSHTDLEGKGALSFSSIFHSPAYKALPLSVKLLYVLLHGLMAGTAMHIVLWMTSDGVTSVHFFWCLGVGALCVHLLWLLFALSLEWYVLVKERKSGKQATKAKDKNTASHSVSSNVDWWKKGLCFTVDHVLHFIIVGFIDLAIVVYGAKNTSDINYHDDGTLTAQEYGRMSIWFNLALATVLKTGFCILVIVRMLERHIDHQVHGQMPDSSANRAKVAGKGASGTSSQKVSQAQHSMSTSGFPYQQVPGQAGGVAVPSSGSVWRGTRPR